MGGSKFQTRQLTGTNQSDTVQTPEDAFKRVCELRRHAQAILRMCDEQFKALGRQPPKGRREPE